MSDFHRRLDEILGVTSPEDRPPTHLSEAWQSAAWERKVWGNVLHLMVADGVAVSVLRVNRGYRCSRHRHLERANQFTVISGCIRVCRRRWTAEKPREGIWTDVVTLFPGDSYTVPSCDLHCFEVVEDGVVVETYWADRGGAVSLDDIERLDVGGPM